MNVIMRDVLFGIGLTVFWMVVIAAVVLILGRR